MSEKLPESKEKSPLEKCREEVALWKAEELAKKKRGETYDPHADEVDPEVIFDDEMWLWEKSKAETIVASDFKEYEKRVKARQALEAMLINRFGRIQLREMRERREKK